MAFNGESAAQVMIEALGWTLLDFVWQGALIVAAYALVRAVVATRPASWRLATGYLALAGFALTPLLTFFHHFESLQASAAWASPVSTSLAFSAAMGSSAEPLTWSFDPLLPYVVSAWSLGVACLVVRGLWRWRGIRRICLDAQPLPTVWQKRIIELHARVGLRLKVLVRESAQVAAPILVGWIKPTVLLPLGLCTRMPIDQLELILTHEFAHVRRFDAWANAVQLALETLLFYHPAVHWVGRRVRDDRELCCDELVTAVGGDRLTYARALLALAEERREQHMGNLALAATGGILLGRVEKLLGVSHDEKKAPTLIRLEGLLPAALISMGVVMLANPFESSLIESPPSDQAIQLSPVTLGQPSMDALAPVLNIVVHDLQPNFARLSAAIAQVPEAEPTLASSVAIASAQEPSAGFLTTIAIDAQPNRATPSFISSAAADITIPTATPDQRPTALSAVSEVNNELEPVETLRVFKRTAPFYPRSPLTRGIEGDAELSFRIDRAGKAIDIQVVRASQKAFGIAAVDALKRWQFDPAQSGSQQHLQGFDFNLPNTDAEGNCLQSTGTRLCRRIPS